MSSSPKSSSPKSQDPSVGIFKQPSLAKEPSVGKEPSLVGQPSSSSPSKKTADRFITRREAELSADHATLQRPLPIQFLATFLRDYVAADKFYTTLFIYLPFVALFFVFYLNGRDIEVNHMAGSTNQRLYLRARFPSNEQNAASLDSQGFTDDPRLPQDKTFFDVRSAREYYEWFRSVLIPNTWDCNLPGYSRQTLFKRGQLQYIGAMKVRFLNTRSESCLSPTDGVDDGFLTSALSGGSSGGFSATRGPATNASSLAPASPNTKAVYPRMSCYSSQSSDALDKRPRCDKSNPARPAEALWRYLSPDDDPKAGSTTGQLDNYPAGGYTAILPFNATCNQVRAFHGLMAGGFALPNASTFSAEADPDGCVIVSDAATRFAIAEWFQYGTQTDTFFMGKLFFEITTGGSWVATQQLRMFPVWTTKRLFASIFDIIFFIYVLYFVYRLIYEWILFYRAERKILAFCFDIWNLIEVVNVCTFIAVVVLRWIWWTRSQSSKISFPFANAYPSDLDSLVLLFSYQVYANSINAVMTTLKILKFVQLNKRLNVLTRTLFLCQQALIGVLVIFCFVVLGYCVCATILFGSNMEAFRNVNTSFSSLLFMLLGEFDYPAMRALQPTFAGFYYFSFVILANFLLLNFIVAVLGDGFSQVIADCVLEPLDDSILASLNSVGQFFTVKNLKKVFELRKQGKSRNELLAMTEKYLVEQMEIIATSNPALLDTDYPIHLRDLRHWLPEHLYSDLGESYISRIWLDAHHDLDLERQTASYLRRRELEDVVTRATDGQFPIIKRAEGMSRQLEATSYNTQALLARLMDPHAAAASASNDVTHDEGRSLTGSVAF